MIRTTCPRRSLPAAERHRVHERLLRQPKLAAPTDRAAMAAIQTQYYGMIAEADHQLGRVWAALEAAGAWDDTLIVVTADHGEQMGDHGLIEKAGWFEQSYHILGLVRDPRAPRAHGTIVERFTENVDIFPTLCEAMGVAIPAQCDGRSLTPLLQGLEPSDWRDAAHWEWDWRASFIALGPHDWPIDRRLERSGLAVLRTNDAAYVQFGDGDALAFDLATDPTWRTPLSDPLAELALAKAMLAWRMDTRRPHLDRHACGRRRCRPLAAHAAGVGSGRRTEDRGDANMTSETGRVAWVTGASSGIGAALAKALGDAGWDVILSGRREDALRSMAAEMAGGALVLPFEATDYDALTGVVERAMSWRGGVDLLVNNAGISQRSLGVDTGFDVYRRLMEVDFFAPLRLTQLVLPGMIERRSGAIVAISSLAGRIGSPLRTGYCGGQARPARLFRGAPRRGRDRIWRDGPQRHAGLRPHRRRGQRLARRRRGSRHIRREHRQRDGSRRGRASDPRGAA